MGVEVLGEGGDVSRHKKKAGVLPVAFLCPFGPSWPPLVCSVVSVAFSMRHGLLILCRRAAVGRVVLVVFQGCFRVPGASCGAFLH